MRQADAVLQEVWRVKDAALAQVGGDGHRLVQQLREQSAKLRAELSAGIRGNITVPIKPAPLQPGSLKPALKN
jgi:hypothetical protein